MHKSRDILRDRENGESEQKGRREKRKRRRERGKRKKRGGEGRRGEEREGEARAPTGKNQTLGKRKQPHPYNQLVLGPDEP